ncbi:MAG: hypothetical protein M3N57_06945 [Actinomycetota bacterium]|nr:hypothetical protein [Actinomycetota bacterium]
MRTEVELDDDLLRLAEDCAVATGKPRDRIIEDALRRQLQPSRLAQLAAKVRARSDLTDEQALELAYSELEAERAERPDTG